MKLIDTKYIVNKYSNIKCYHEFDNVFSDLKEFLAPNKKNTKHNFLLIKCDSFSFPVIFSPFLFKIYWV